MNIFLSSWGSIDIGIFQCWGNLLVMVGIADYMCQEFVGNRYISHNCHVLIINQRHVMVHFFGMVFMFLLARPTQAALQDTSACPCPNQDDPVAVLTCYLEKPINNSMRGIGNCLAKAEDGYPGKPSYDSSRPNIYRSYRILSVADGKPYRGQATKRISIQFDYVYRINDEPHNYKPLCKVRKQTVTAYSTETGWLISHPYDWVMSFKLQPLLTSANSFVEKEYANKNYYSVRDMSTKILFLESSAQHCPKPAGGDW